MMEEESSERMFGIILLSSQKRISMAERSGFSCAGECTVKSGRGFPEIFPGTGSGISAL